MVIALAGLVFRRAELINVGFKDKIIQVVVMMKLKKYGIALSLILSAALLAGCSSDPMPEALVSLESAEVHTDYYLFEAQSPRTDVCYVYYPGGMVDTEAYAPYLAAVAAQGVHAFLLRVSFGLAILDVDAAEHAKLSDFAKNHCQQYVLGGHSLGGIAAADYLQNNPDDGIVFVASYPPENTVLNEHKKPVMVIYASNDLLATEAEIMGAASNLPASTEFMKIDGGNHSQFGWYGPQNRDGEATISREYQQELLLKYTLQVIDQM